MSIASITLRNFQSHRKRKIRLSPTVTTIVGSTDRGKSAILRALRWVALGKPTGAAFVKDGTKQAKAIVSLGVPCQIQRIRGLSRVNAYVLREKAGKRRFQALNRQVPPAVTKLLNLQEINFQDQHDSPFWFSDTPGVVSKKLNAIVDLELVDRVLGGLQSKVRASSAKAEANRALLQEAKRERKRLAYVPKMRKSHERVLQKLATWKGLFKRLGDLRNAVAELEEASREAKRPVPDFSAVEAAYSELLTWTKERKALKQDILELRRARKDVVQAKAALDKAEIEFHKNIKGKRCPLCQNLM